MTVEKTGFGIVLISPNQGSAVPDLDFTNPISPLLRLPSMVTSERKFVLPTTCPDRDFVCAMSPEFTLRSAVVSPARTPIGTTTLPVLIPSLTPTRVIPIVCALDTPVRFTKTLLPLVLVLLTVPVPDVTVAEVNVTGAANVRTIW